MSTLTVTETSADRPPEETHARTRPAVVLVLLVAFQLMVATDLTVANIAMPAIQESLGFSTVNLAWVINAYTLAFGGLLLLGGRIGDIFGRRRVFIGGVVLFTVASLLAGMATTPTLLLLARVAQGVGSALAAPSALALVTSNFAEGGERNRAIGLYAASGALGASVGLILGGVLTDWVSWRWVLWINVPVGIAIAATTTRFVRDGERQTGRLDTAGALTSTVGVTALVYGFIRASVEGWTDPVTVGAFAVGAGLLVLFVLIELRTRAPLTPLRLFADRDRVLVYGIMMLLVATVMGSFFFLAQFLQEVRGYSPLSTGVAFLPLTGIVLFFSGRATQLVDRLGARLVVSGGVVLVLAGALWVSQISASTGYATGILGPLVLMGLGISANIGTLTVLAMGGVDEQDSGAASGLLQVMQQFGISIGLAVLVTVFGTASRNASGGPDQAMAEGIGSAYLLGSLFAATALLMALLLSRPTVSRSQPLTEDRVDRATWR